MPIIHTMIIEVCIPDLAGDFDTEHRAISVMTQPCKDRVYATISTTHGTGSTQQGETETEALRKCLEAMSIYPGPVPIISKRRALHYVKGHCWPGGLVLHEPNAEDYER